jgi:hypothetical protein
MRYYPSIHYAALLRRCIDDPVVLDLVCGYLHRNLCRAGCSRFVTRLGTRHPRDQIGLRSLDERCRSLG